MVPQFARRLGWRSLKKVAAIPGDRRSATFWRKLARDLAQAMAEHNIWKPIQAAHFISQICHESARFTATVEFSSGKQYEGRAELGNTHPGDGPRYKGRSFMMITGRANYRALPHWDGIDFEAHPERLGEQKYAAKGAAHWWEAAGLNAVAIDSRDSTILRITRRINGGTNGLTERTLYFNRANDVKQFLTPSRRAPS